MTNWNLLFLFIHIFICLFCLWNTFHKSIFLTILSPIVWKFCIIFNIFLIFLISQLSIDFLFFKLLLLYVPLVVIYFLYPFLIFIWRQQFYFQFECFLNNIIAQIKIGANFRSAFKQVIVNLPSQHFKNYFREILDTILFSKKLRKEFCFNPLQQMIIELKNADQSSHCLEYLENIRHQVRIHSVFRKKVHSALLQIRVQSIVLWILYSGLFIFILHKYGLKYIKVLCLSLSFFIIGLIILFHCGRRVKWTI